MPIQQPPIEEDPAKASWYLDLVREINRLENTINNLRQRIEDLENDQNSNS